jgi:hypothetical protein
MLAVGALALGACGGGSSPAAVRLDGSPRVPDAEGVVVKASRNGITLNHGRRYKVSGDLVAFSTYNRKPIPLAATIGDYVHVGLDGDEVQWIGLIGLVVADADGHRTTSYQGTLVAVKGKQLQFRDGTVLRLAPNLTAPKDPLGSVYAAIDVDKGVVQGATFPPTTHTKD